MYYNHNLRTDLQEWKNRLVRADYNQFGNQLKYFFDNIDNNKILKSIIDESIAKYPFTDEYFRSLEDYQRYFDRNFEKDNMLIVTNKIITDKKNRDDYYLDLLFNSLFYINDMNFSEKRRSYFIETLKIFPSI